MLRPVKIEMVWRKPRIFIFRDLLSSVEAKQIKDIATPKVSYHLVECNAYPVKFCPPMTVDDAISCKIS